MKNVKNYHTFHFVTYRHWKKHYFDQPQGSSLYSFRCLSKGTGRLMFRDRVLELEEGDLFYIPRNIPYQAYFEGEEYAEIITCSTAIFPEAQSVTYYPPYWAKAKKGEKDFQTVPLDFEPQKLPRKFAAEFLAIPRDSAPDTRALAMFFTWLDRVIPYLKVEDQHSDAHLAERAVAYMERNPSCKMADVAKHCGISEPGLYNRIRKATGRTPNMLRQEVLTRKAVQLLHTTDMSVHDISDMLLFSSPNYFRKILKDYTGKSPSQLRNDGKGDR